MDIYQLKTFVAVARCLDVGDFCSAAWQTPLM